MGVVGWINFQWLGDGGWVAGSGGFARCGVYCWVHLRGRDKDRDRETKERLKREIGEERKMSFLLLIYYVVYIILLGYMYKKELKYWVYY